jgi:hypothetical protein
MEVGVARSGGPEPGRAQMKPSRFVEIERGWGADPSGPVEMMCRVLFAGSLTDGVLVWGELPG